MARPMPRAPPVTIATLAFSFIAASRVDRAAALIEAMQMLRLRHQADLVGGMDAELAGAARGHLPDAGHIDVEEGVAAEMLGDADRALPAVAVAGHGDVFGADADGGGTRLLRRRAADEVHL